MPLNVILSKDLLMSFDEVRENAGDDIAKHTARKNGAGRHDGEIVSRLMVLAFFVNSCQTSFIGSSSNSEMFLPKKSSVAE